MVAAAGAVDHDELVKLSEDAFSSLSTDPTTAYDLVAKVRLLRLQSSRTAETLSIHLLPLQYVHYIPSINSAACASSCPNA